MLSHSCQLNSLSGKAPKDSAEVLARFYEALPIVKPQALKIRSALGPPAELDDLVSYGLAGLLEAARRFDSERGATFLTFAKHRIRGAMLDGVRKLSRLPRRLNERLKEQKGASPHAAAPSRHASSTNSCHSNSSPHLAAHLAGVASALGLVWEVGIEDRGATTAVSAAPSPEEELVRRQLLERVRTGVAALPPQEAQLIRRHYFEGVRFDHIAGDLGLSKSWTSRLHTRAIERLARRLSCCA